MECRDNQFNLKFRIYFGDFRFTFRHENETSPVEKKNECINIEFSCKNAVNHHARSYEVKIVMIEL